MFPRWGSRLCTPMQVSSLSSGTALVLARGPEPHGVKVGAVRGCMEAFWGGGGLQWGGGEERHSELDPHSRLPLGSLPWATHIHVDIYTGWEQTIQPRMAMCLPVQRSPKSHTDPTRIKRLGMSQNKYFTVNY